MIDVRPIDVSRMGPEALLISCAEGASALIAEQLRAEFGEDALDIVPAASTVMFRARRREVINEEFTDRVRIAAQFATQHEHSPTAEVIDIPVTYDGPDLDDVAGTLHLSVEEVVAAHVSATYVVAFCGFAPGFAYLTGLDPRLHLPRRSTPRTRVPAGSVSIAAHYSAVYPSPSPGGWHLLGTTDVVLWDEHRANPALLTPGAEVRFRRV